MAVDAKALEAGGAIVLTLLPVVLGGASSYFNLFVESPKDFRSRVSLTRQKLLEGVNESLSALLRGVVDISTGTSDVLRGDGMQAPDLVGDFTRVQLRSFLLLDRLLSTERVLQWGHKVLLLTTMAGIIVFVIAVLAASWRWLLVYLTVVLVVTQVATVASVYGYSRRLDDLEDLIYRNTLAHHNRRKLLPSHLLLCRQLCRPHIYGKPLIQCRLSNVKIRGNDSVRRD